MRLISQPDRTDAVCSLLATPGDFPDDGRRHELVSGSWDARLEQALRAVARLS